MLNGRGGQTDSSGSWWMDVGTMPGSFSWTFDAGAVPSVNGKFVYHDSWIHVSYFIEMFNVQYRGEGTVLPFSFKDQNTRRGGSWSDLQISPCVRKCPPQRDWSRGNELEKKTGRPPACCTDTAVRLTCSCFFFNSLFNQDLIGIGRCKKKIQMIWVFVKGHVDLSSPVPITKRENHGFHCVSNACASQDGYLKGFPVGAQVHKVVVAVPEISIHGPVCMLFACSKCE